ncbi:MAG: hypothetical protein HYR85_12830, partial [Planctomycetes bacterium]|nr:hypothetical protein [Planctomycetota bacterium]
MPEAPCAVATRDARALVRTLAGAGPVALAVPYDREYRDLATIEVPFPDDYSLPEALAATRASLTILCNPNSPSGTRVPLDGVRGLAECIRGRLLVDERDLDSGVVGASTLGLENVTVIRSPSSTSTASADALRATRDRTIRALRAFRFDVWPSEAPYILARVGPEASSLRDALAEPR